MSELIRELEEDAQRERLMALWAKWGNWLIGGALLIVVGTALGVGIGAYKRSKAEARTDTLLHAQTPETLQQVIEKNEGSTQAALAAMQLAGQLRESGKNAEALQAYRAVAEKNGYDEALRNLARLHAINLATQMKQELEFAPVAEDAPFAASLREAGAWHALAMGKTDEALQQFNALQGDVSSPPSLRQRAAQAVATLGK